MPPQRLEQQTFQSMSKHSTIELSCHPVPFVFVPFVFVPFTFGSQQISQFYYKLTKEIQSFLIVVCVYSAKYIKVAQTVYFTILVNIITFISNFFVIVVW